MQGEMHRKVKIGLSFGNKIEGKKYELVEITRIETIRG